MRKEDMIRFVRRTMPKLTIDTSEIKTNGWDNDILIVNKQQVFRFPKTDQIRDQIKGECVLLRQLEQKKPALQIPRYKLIYEGKTLRAITYPFMSGESLNEHPVDLRRNPENAQLLGDFLMKLHQIAGGFLPTRHTFCYWQVLLESLRKKVFSALRDEECQAIEDVFTRFLNRYTAFSKTKAVIHGDLSASNILFDQKTNRISGIIDFTDGQIGDPAFDFAGIYWNYGPEYTKEVLSFYQTDESIDEMFDRLSTFYGLQPVFHELLYSVENNEPIDHTQLKRFMELKQMIS
ncbi:phosphotransferase family protein [Sporolactobacillus terrae]|uniref:Aminoglycoside phosphotransferase n=1 Tax=Sporolactobacillus terrae TaxID=269673 RepID=A0A5K7WUQ3_9BACL|nr:aminoglycoside phosphotransferase family protein [Sporolactobacillus terrae]BBN98057.1 aminoglycoside phosphotransferase [Sporolactobacillus terrae]